MDYIRYLRNMVGPKPVIMVTAGVVIFNGAGELLLQHRADGTGWGLIGGFIELGESLEEAARSFRGNQADSWTARAVRRL